MKVFHDLIKEICEEENIGYQVLSKDWLLMLEKDGITKFICGYKFDLVGHALGNIMDDKYATYEVLLSKNIPVIPHFILFRPSNHCEYAINSNDYHQAHLFFQENNQDIVIKANEGTCGNEVYHIQNVHDMDQCLNKLFITNFSVSLCPFYSIKTEYRIIILRNRPVLIYGKRRPIVVGDGKKTIRELLLEFNPYYFQNRLQDVLYSRVLEKNQEYQYSWQFNLSKGSVSFHVDDSKTRDSLFFIVNQVIQELKPGFCSIDIIETIDGKKLIMELNSGVMMRNYLNFVSNGREVVKNIYKQAVLEMFLDENELNNK